MGFSTTVKLQPEAAKVIKRREYLLKNRVRNEEILLFSMNAGEDEQLNESKVFRNIRRSSGATG
jgi:hypothetical protein